MLNGRNLHYISAFQKSIRCRCWLEPLEWLSWRFHRDLRYCSQWTENDSCLEIKENTKLFRGEKACKSYFRLIWLIVGWNTEWVIKLYLYFEASQSISTLEAFVICALKGGVQALQTPGKRKHKMEKTHSTAFWKAHEMTQCTTSDTILTIKTFTLE